MSDRNFSPDSHHTDDNPRADALVDSLLRESADNPGRDDEAFLASVESALDTVEFSTDPPFLLRPAFRTRILLAGSSAVAALLAAGVCVVLNFVHVRSERPESTFAVQVVEQPESLALSMDRKSTMTEPASPKVREWGTPPVPGATDRFDSQLYTGIYAGYDGDYSLSTESTEVNQTRNGTPRLSEIGLVVDFDDLSVGTASQYSTLVDSEWAAPTDKPLSTFSIDVDTASWTNVRGMIRSGLTAGQIPDDAVRIEEMINYFDWNYSPPRGDHPFATHVEVAACPWNSAHRLLKVGLQGRVVDRGNRPSANLVFLLDVSGSMDQANKLPLVKHSISNLIEELRENDKVSIVVYAGAEGLALPPTSGRDRATISKALSFLSAGGSTNGGAGIGLAYRLAREQFMEEGVNRVILCTDGDFNVGMTNTDELVRLVEREADSGVFLTVCGFGQDNLNDAMLEKITNRGNGNYYYIDGEREGRKVFRENLMGTLVTIAKDVKIQIEFNPSEVTAYRLIGYANRRLNAEDFENDEVDAGEIGSGHTVTALYEIVPAGADRVPAATTPKLRYQVESNAASKREITPSNELAHLKLRYKLPDGDRSILIEDPILPGDRDWKQASDDFRFAAAVALFGMILREHDSVSESTLQEVVDLAGNSLGHDPHGRRAEFVELVHALATRQ